MRLFRILLILTGFGAHPDLCAVELLTEILDWKPGQEVPHRLLSFPDGDVSSIDPNVCGLASYMESVRPYIDEIESDALLEAIVFEPRASGTSFHAAVTRLVGRKGLNWLASRLEQKQATRWEHQAFRQMLQSKFLRVSVAFVESRHMDASEASRELEVLRNALDAGKPWREAYLELADRHPDVERRKLDPQVPTTLITYLYNGWISALGFDFTQLGIAPYFPKEHLNLVPLLGKGGKIVASPKGVYLFYVFEVYDPNA